MKTFLKKYLLSIILLFAGGVGGFLYWKFVGCLDGTCAIKSNPTLMTMYGSVFGFLIGSIITDFVIKKPAKDKKTEV